MVRSVGSDGVVLLESWSFSNYGVDSVLLNERLLLLLFTHPLFLAALIVEQV